MTDRDERPDYRSMLRSRWAERPERADREVNIRC